VLVCARIPADRYGNARAMLRELRGQDGHPRRRLPRNFSLSIALAWSRFWLVATLVR